MTAPEGERPCRTQCGGTRAPVAFVEAEGVISAVLSDPGCRRRERVEAAETELGLELSAHLQPFQDCYEQAVAAGDADGLPGSVRASTAAGGGSALLPDGHETSWRDHTGAATAKAGRSHGWQGT